MALPPCLLGPTLEGNNLHQDTFSEATRYQENKQEVPNLSSFQTSAENLSSVSSHP